ncbi:MAG: CoA pyrophosphatase [Pseudomonadota bacterium]
MTSSMSNLINYVSDAELAIIAQHQPTLKTEAARVSAAVTVILRDTDHGTEYLLMQRAQHEGDPWSGQMGFPGGKIEQSDADSKQAAMREAYEEVGIDLAKADYIGQLDDLYGFKIDGVYVVHIASFVFKVSGDVAIVPNHEVAEIVWLPIGWLEDKNKYHAFDSPKIAKVKDMPSIAIDLQKQQVLWGITLRIVLSFCDLVQRPVNALPESAKTLLRHVEQEDIASKDVVTD